MNFNQIRIIYGLFVHGGSGVWRERHELLSKICFRPNFKAFHFIRWVINKKRLRFTAMVWSWVHWYEKNAILTGRISASLLLDCIRLFYKMIHCNIQWGSRQFEHWLRGRSCRLRESEREKKKGNQIKLFVVVYAIV